MRLSPSILRVAGWPIETAERLRSPALATWVDEWLSDERVVEERAAHVSQILHDEVPAIGNRTARALVLHLRRCVFGSAAPLPERPLRDLLSCDVLSPRAASALRQEAEERLTLARKRVVLEAAYRRALNEELGALQDVAGDLSFQRALYLASPSLTQAWRTAVLQRVPFGKVHCRVYRYLMRAAGRCTPNGNWCGVALESESAPSKVDQVQVFPTRSQVLFAPRLAPLVAALGTTADLPGSFSDAWEILDDLAASLPEGERLVWLGLIAGLRPICSELESKWDRIALDHLQNLLDRARDAVNCVLRSYGVPAVRPDEQVLVADLRAPFEFALGRDVKQEIACSLREYWRFDRFGLGEILAKAERERTFRLPAGASAGPVCAWLPVPKNSIGLIGTWEHIIATTCDGRHEEDARASLCRWYAELEPVWRARLCHISGDSFPDDPPLAPGSALVKIEFAGSNLAIRIGALTPDPCLFYSRFHRLFQAAEVGDAFSRWYRNELRKTQALHRTLLFADLAARATADSNAAVRPRFCDLLVDLEKDEFPASGSIIHVDTDGRGHWIMLDGRELVPMLHSAVALEDSDPCRSAHEIARLIGRPSLMRPIPVFGRELAEWLHLPRISIGAGAVISPERWIAPATLVAELAGETGLARFIAWRRFVVSAGLPSALYWKHHTNETELLMYADSVLAVEDLGRTLAIYPGAFRLQEAFPSTGTSWVCDKEGRHYVAELAVAWAGDDEYWSEYANAVHCNMPAAGEAGV